MFFIKDTGVTLAELKVLFGRMFPLCLQRSHPRKPRRPDPHLFHLQQQLSLYIFQLAHSQLGPWHPAMHRKVLVKGCKEGDWIERSRST